MLICTKQDIPECASVHEISEIFSVPSLRNERHCSIIGISKDDYEHPDKKLLPLWESVSLVVEADLIVELLDTINVVIYFAHFLGSSIDEKDHTSVILDVYNLLH